MDTLGNLTPQDYDRIASMAGGVSAGQEKNSALESQLKLAESLRNPGQAGHMAGPNVYVGNNALQSLSSAAAAYKGQQSIDQMMQLAHQQQDARTAYIQMMVDQLRGGKGQPMGQDLSQAGDAPDPNMQLDPTQQGGPQYA